MARLSGEVSTFLNQSLPLSRKIGDRIGEAAVLYSFGQSYLAQRHFGQAVQYLIDAIVISRQLGDRVHEVNALESLAIALASIGIAKD
jgi:hypothetical protein